MPAQTVKWTGGVDGDFDGRNNWDLKIVPDSLDTVVVPSTASQAMTTNLDRSGSGIAATGTLTLTGQPLNTETVTLDAKVYTFQTSLTDSDGNVLIGATAEASASNLTVAVNLGAGAGTAYAASMTLHPTVFAEYPGDLDSDTGTALVYARQVVPGASGVTSTETLTNGSFGGGTLSGESSNGADFVQFYVEAGAPAIGASGSPLRCTAAKIKHEGRNTFYLTADYGSTVDEIDRLIVNSKNLVDAMVLSDDGSAFTTLLEVLSGGVTYAGTKGVTTLRMSNASGNNKPRLTTTSTGSTTNAFTNVEMQNGQLTTGLPITTLVMGGGTLTTTATGGASGSETAGTVYQTGGLFKFNAASTIATFLLMGGVMDTTQTTGTKTVTDMRQHPSGRLIKNDDFYGGTPIVLGA